MYENINHLLADLMEELSFPSNVRQVLGKNEPLRMWAENLVNAFMANRIGYTAICGADETELVYKYCKHRQYAACTLHDNDCRFKSPRKRGGEGVKVVENRCVGCGAKYFHTPGCPNVPKPDP